MLLIACCKLVTQLKEHQCTSSFRWCDFVYSELFCHCCFFTRPSFSIFSSFNFCSYFFEINKTTIFCAACFLQQCVLDACTRFAACSECETIFLILFTLMDNMFQPTPFLLCIFSFQVKGQRPFPTVMYDISKFDQTPLLVFEVANADENFQS